MAETFYILDGSVFLILGVLHLIYTLLDISRPRRLVPDDPQLIEAIQRSTLRLTRGRTTMWNAWVSFNFSHSLGVIWFGASCIMLGIATSLFAVPKQTLVTPVIFGALLFSLAVHYWFKAPAIGIAIGTVLLASGWLTY